MFAFTVSVFFGGVKPTVLKDKIDTEIDVEINRRAFKTQQICIRKIDANACLAMPGNEVTFWGRFGSHVLNILWFWGSVFKHRFLLSSGVQFS